MWWFPLTGNPGRTDRKTLFAISYGGRVVVRGPSPKVGSVVAYRRLNLDSCGMGKPMMGPVARSPPN